jgi:ParB/RepB/Spo0J family partition protein
MNIDNELIVNLKTDSSNPNKMTKEQIQSVANSIKKFGFLVPIIVNKDNVIIDGHQRLKAADLLGIEEVPVVKLDVDKIDAKLLKQIMNKLKGQHNYELDLAEYKEILAAQGNLDDLKELVAMSDEYIDNILREISPKGTYTDEQLDDVPEVEGIKTDIVYGDIFQLGRHRIMAGDSTKKEDVDKLMNGQKADMVFTDPPYLMDFEGNVHSDGSKSHNASFGKIKNDKLTKEEGLEFLDAFIKNIINYNKGAYYITFYRLGIDKLWNSLSNNDLNVKSIIIWSKGNHTLSNSDYMSKYEPIFYGWVKEHNFYNKPEFDIWEVKRTAKNELHPTMKPVELITRAINNSSKLNELVLDLFLGSGSTLIACEQTGRICYGMELDPKYCEVICQRWEKLTNKKRELVV